MTTQTVSIPHLGGSTIGYRLGAPYKPDLPTLVMVNSFSTSVELYRPQFADQDLLDAANLLAIEPYGHGETRAGLADFTYWDSAIANLEVLDALGIDKTFAMGTSQGGWIVARMAMLAPERIQGIVPLGTSMDYESQRSRDLGCWDAPALLSPIIDMLADGVGDDWSIPGELTETVLVSGLGENVDDETREFWYSEHPRIYTGDDGRRRVRSITINLRDRDGLHGRVDEVRCPVLWLHGTSDQVYSAANAEEEIGLFTNSADAQLKVIDGGQHFLSASNPRDVNSAVIEFVRR